ncbi:MAG: hypothetical protein L0228_00215 [Planctomycetes bacterium]|nr:hypothetical protein [Planctomycetota bacterium]
MPQRVIAIRLHLAILVAGACLAATGVSSAQDVVMPGVGPAGMDNSAAPMSHYSEGSYFSQDLGTTLRLRYSTESYGQPDSGNFDIGTMQVFPLDGSAAFFDGQVTLNEQQGVGYNLGVGFRAMHFPALARDAGRIAGVSLWTDGTSTDGGNFFPQIGLSLESLGDMWDFRANGYLPLGPQDQIGEFVPTGVTGFEGFSISELTQAVLSTSYSVAELEAARRLGSERDAWAFAGPYFVGNDDDDSVGYRIGVRGYAYPDLLLQIAVSDDEIFKTNAAFSVTWFVGRTRTDFQPACGVPDRFREPVMRNDYVALAQSFVQGGIPLTQPDGSALRIVHVDSDAPDGGDGSFENPFNMLTDINGGGSMEGDIVLAHALSVFTGEGSVTLKDNQRLLGEGNGVEHTVATAEEGTIVIPETFAGARAAARPMLLGPAPGGDAIILADANEVNNFDIDGQGVTNRAIASPGTGSGNPVLRNLAISNTVDDAIALTPLSFVDTNDVDNDGNVTETIVRGNVTIDDVVFDNIGADDIDINAFTTTDITLPNTTLQEVITITDVSSTNNNGRSIAIANTHSGVGRTATVNNFTWDGGTTGLGGIVLTNFDSTFNATNSTLTNGAVAGAGAQILGDSDGTMTFANTVVFNFVDGTAVDIDGDDGGTDALGGTIAVNGVINNDTGRSVSVRNVGTGANIDFNGNITDSGTGILVDSNSGGTITFIGTLDMDIDTAGGTAILATDNMGATVEFTGPVNINNTGDARGLVATGGGTLRYSNTGNAITTETGQVVVVQNMTIAGQGVIVNDINRTAGDDTAAVQLEDNTGGPIVLGDVTSAMAGDSGTLEGGAADVVVINDSANVTLSGVIINNAAGFSGVHIEKTTAGTQTTNLNDLDINNGDRGVEVSGMAGAGALNMSINDTTIDTPTNIGLSINDVDTGTSAFNNVDIDGNNVGAKGVVIANSNATFNFDANSEIREFDSTDFEVTGAGSTSAGTISFAGDIVNSSAVNPGDTSGMSVHIHEVTGGAITFTAASSINDNNEGMLVENNTGSTIQFQGDNDFNTGANTAVTIDNNAGATISLSNLNIDTTTGNGFVATNGGTLTVLGTTNTIDTEDGVGLQIEDMTIGGTAPAGVSFQSVNVISGITNGIVLRDLAGTGQVSVGNVGGAANSGGALTTAGDAIVLENVANADFNHVQIVSAGGIGVNIDHTAAATNTMDITFNDLNLDLTTGLGMDVDGASAQTFNLRINNSDIEESVVMDNTGAGAFRILLDNTDVTTTGTDEALQVTLGGSTADADLTIQNGSALVAANARALDMAVNGGGSSVEILLEASTFTSAMAEDVSIVNNVGDATDATIRNNTFSNSAAAEDVVILSSGSAGVGTRLDLNLVNNGLAGSTISLETMGTAAGTFNFGVVDRDNANANNPANVTFTPLITDFENIDATDVELPNGP